MLVGVLGEINEPRQVTADGLISAMDKEIITWDAGGLGVNAEQVGLKASPTWVEGSYEKRIVRAGLMLEGTPAEMVRAAVLTLRNEGLL